MKWSMCDNMNYKTIPTNLSSCKYAWNNDFYVLVLGNLNVYISMSIKLSMRDNMNYKILPTNLSSC